MSEYNWCQRCGGESFGKKFCQDCCERLEKCKKYLFGYEEGDLLRKIGMIK